MKIDLLSRIAFLALCLLLGIGILDVNNTLEMRTTALITLVMLVAAGVAHLMLQKQQEIVKGFLKDLTELKKLVLDYEESRRNKT